MLAAAAHTAKYHAPSAALPDRLLGLIGFDIDEIVVVGHRHTLDADVFTALRADGTVSLLRFDAMAARRRIEALPWVETARIARILPGTLRVDIVERRPIAVWRDRDSHHLIDATGRRLARVPAADMPDLPRLAGVGAPEAAASLLEALALHPRLRPRVVVSHRIGQRRWTLELADETRVLLPEHGLDHGLQQLADLEAAGNRAPLPGAEIVDLRHGSSLVALRSATPETEVARTAAPASRRGM